MRHFVGICTEPGHLQDLLLFPSLHAGKSRLNVRHGGAVKVQDVDCTQRGEGGNVSESDRETADTFFLDIFFSWISFMKIMCLDYKRCIRPKS